MSFSEKQKLLFESLNAAEKNISGSVLAQKPSSIAIDQFAQRPITNTSNTKKFRGRNSIFKRPEAPIAKCLKSKRTPDFKANPQKWTKYTLEDVDTSERSNSAAAFAFLNEIEKKKAIENSEEEEDSIADITIKRPAFNKALALKKKLADDDDVESAKAQIKGSKVVMPEYVIGQKAKKPKKERSSSSKSEKTEMKLDHLMHEEDEDE